MTSQRQNVRTYQGTAPLVTRTYVARKPLAMGGHTRLPGQLIPEAGTWSGKALQCHIDLNWIEEITLTNDADRDAFEKQYQAEEAARAEAAKQHPKPDTWSIPDHKRPPLPVSYNCANCGALHTWPEPPRDTDWFHCLRCGQHQAVSMAKAGVLRLSSPAFNHNRKAPTFREES